MSDAKAVYDDLRFITEFTVTDQHLKLMRRAYVEWDDCEFGAPGIDCKRPYGNSDVIDDLAGILEVPGWDSENDDDERDATVVEELTRLHAETATVLQIALTTGEFRAGRYVREKYGSWQRAGE